MSLFYRLVQAALITFGHASLQSFAVIRPFAPSDTASLPSSFDVWDTHIPCLQSAVPVDLFLCFSQNVTTNLAARRATDEVVSEFNKKKAQGDASTWHHCFRSINVVSAGLSPEDDVYQPNHSMQTTTWVRGPNLQFLAMAQAFETKAWGQYDAWYLMEMDSVPRMAHWLDALVAEVDDRAPFAVLGSFYRGDSWDSLTLDLEVKLHINGNAVYNSTNRLMKAFTAQLAVEMAAKTLTPAFDVLLTRYYLSQDLAAEEFSWYNGESSVIGNYAHTTMIDAYFNGEAIVHGAWLFDSWDEPVALVVSDFGLHDQDGTPDFDNFKQRFLSGHNPFREVVAMRSAISQAQYSEQINGNDGPELVTFKEVVRTESAWLDWCAAEVSSPWFMYTNTFFDFGRRIDLMQELDTRNPVIGFIPADGPYCSNYVTCSESVRRASEFTGQPLTRHVDTHHMVFNTATRNAFCAKWKAWQQVTPEAAPSPSADDYVAFLAAFTTSDLYSFKDATIYGQRPVGVIQGTDNNIIGNNDTNCTSNVTGNCTNDTTTNTTCDPYPNEAVCTAEAGCAWHPRFGTCFAGSLPANVQPPALTVTHSHATDCQVDLVLPIITVETSEPSPVALLVDSVAPFSTSLSAVRVSDGAPVAIYIEANLPEPLADAVVTSSVTLKSMNTQPRLVVTAPFEVFDVRPWNIKWSSSVGGVGMTLTVTSGTPDTTLSADQPTLSSSADELLFEVSKLLQQGITSINIEQSGLWGASNTRVKKCYNVPLVVPSQQIVYMDPPAMQRLFTVIIRPASTSALSYVIVPLSSSGVARRQSDMCVAAFATMTPQQAETTSATLPTDLWLLNVRVELGGIYAICLQDDTKETVAYGSNLIVPGLDSVRIDGKACSSQSESLAAGGRSAVTLEVGGVALQSTDAFVLVGASQACPTNGGVSLGNVNRMASAGIERSAGTQSLPVPQSEEAIHLCYGHSGQWARLATCLNPQAQAATSEEVSSGELPYWVWIIVALGIAVALAIGAAYWMYLNNRRREMFMQELETKEAGTWTSVPEPTPAFTPAYPQDEYSTGPATPSMVRTPASYLHSGVATPSVAQALDVSTSGFATPLAAHSPIYPSGAATPAVGFKALIPQPSGLATPAVAHPASGTTTPALVYAPIAPPPSGFVTPCFTSAAHPNPLNSHVDAPPCGRALPSHGGLPSGAQTPSMRSPSPDTTPRVAPPSRAQSPPTRSPSPDTTPRVAPPSRAQSPSRTAMPDASCMPSIAVQQNPAGYKA